MPDVHIIPDGDRWKVKEVNGEIVSTHGTQAEAEQAANRGPGRKVAARSSPIATRASSHASARATQSDPGR